MQNDELRDQDELTEGSVEGCEEELREQSDEAMIGETRLEDMRQKKIEELTQAYSEELRDKRDMPTFLVLYLDAYPAIRGPWNIITEEWPHPLPVDHADLAVIHAVASGETESSSSDTLECSLRDGEEGKYLCIQGWGIPFTSVGPLTDGNLKIIATETSPSHLKRLENRVEQRYEWQEQD